MIRVVADKPRVPMKRAKCTWRSTIFSSSRAATQRLPSADTGDRETAPTEWRGGDIAGGTDYSLSLGDVLFIPAGVAHRVLVQPKASVTYVTVKIPK